MMYSKRVLVVAALMLASCGGGGGSSTPIGGGPPTGGSGGGGVSPPPMMMPSPDYPVFGTISSDQMVILSAVSLFRVDTSTSNSSTTGATSVTLKDTLGGQVVLNLRDTPLSLAIRDGVRNQTFVESDANSQSAFLGPSFRYFSRGLGTLSAQDFSIYKPQGGGMDPPLRHSTIVFWSRRNVSNFSNGTTELNDNTLFAAGGFQTQFADVPSTGQDMTIGPLRGAAISGTALGTFEGQYRLTTDFGAKTVQIRLNLNVFPAAGGPFAIVIEGNGTVSTNRFEGSFGSDRGTFSGTFNGPRGVETSFAFRHLAADGTTFAGAGAGN